MNIQSTLKGPGQITARAHSTDLDCETAALLRATMLPLFSSAASWDGLREVMRAKGYRLAFLKGRLSIIDRSTGERICGLRFLGLELSDLVRRMGRPKVVARGNQADGELL